jgi:hypothetical protein
MHFFGLEAVQLLCAGNSGMGIVIRGRQPSVFCERIGRKRRGVRARSKCRSARGYTKGEFQKVAAFHDISLFVRGE